MAEWIEYCKDKDITVHFYGERIEIPQIVRESPQYKQWLSNRQKFQDDIDRKLLNAPNVECKHG